MKTNFKSHTLRLIRLFVLMLIFSGLLQGCRTGSVNSAPDLAIEAPKPEPVVLYQYSTLQALIEGAYDGDMTLGSVLAKGDLGIGTFNRLDGELMLVDGVIHQIRADGVVDQPELSVKTPFVCVVPYEAHEVFAIPEGLRYEAFKQWLDEKLVSLNHPYAIRIDANFQYVRTRSVPAQNKPYPRLTQVTRNQPEFEFIEEAGVIVGFRLPEFMAGVNVTGYHLHFLNETKSGGGHLLDFTTSAGDVTICRIDEVRLAFPDTEMFSKTDLAKDITEDVHAVEK